MHVTWKGIWRWHFHAGLLCIPFVIVLAITGSIFLFKPQIDAFADRGVDSLALTGRRATGEQHIAAALASLPGSKLFVYEVPLERDDAVRVHLYAADGAGQIVYVHPDTLEILKTVPHASRLTEIVRTIHGNLLAGKTGAIAIELAAGWAVIMLITGLYLWWPRDSNGLAGALFPRLRMGSRVFWRDLHAVTGLWVSLFALFLLVTAQPWTTVAGSGISKIRAWAAPAPRDWTLGGDDPHAAHRREAASNTLASPLTVDQVIARIAPLRLDPPVRLYLPSEAQPGWRVRSETQNRPRVRELTLDRNTGAVLEDRGFAGKSAFDKTIQVGIAAHEGQLFGLANQLLGLFTALGLIALCVSALVMWWRRRPGGSFGIPAPRVAEFRIGAGLRIAICALAVLLPVLGISILLLWLVGLATRSPSAAARA
ncbi:MAG TPA: PepSY domain-containing protein [Steroidobacteraceae bacterium]|nr:PepSY domain-containing protein [Steroidobacteraceae bacterium]